MKPLNCIFLFLLLCIGLTTVLQKAQPGSQATENLTDTAIEYTTSDCSFVASVDEALPAAQHSYYNDENSSCWASLALCPNSLYTNNNASSKIIKLRLHLPTGLQQHLYSVRLLAKQNSSLAFKPNAIRYSCGYYIYAIAHILI